MAFTNRAARVLVMFPLIACMTGFECSAQPGIQLGADRLVAEQFSIVAGKRVGLITNHTGRLSEGTLLLDTLINRGVKVVAVFAPEHGVRGTAGAGEVITDGKDPKIGVPVFSLYGTTKKPGPEMLKDLDVLVYDIQDVGVRFYTYISTMALAMEAAAEKGIPFVVLDRPNPLGGLKVDGPVIEDSLRSFVGMLPIPVVYGLTCGELAEMINWEGWLGGGVRADLTVISMKGWRRKMLWDQTGLAWIPPSPNLPTFEAALMYPATCLIEATNLSEGRGSERPFQYIGAPFVNGGELCSALARVAGDAVACSPMIFTPTTSKFTGVKCHGVFLKVLNWEAFSPVTYGMELIYQISCLYPSEQKVSKGRLEQLVGVSDPLKQLQNWRVNGFRRDHKVAQFVRLAARYQLY